MKWLSPFPTLACQQGRQMLAGFNHFCIICICCILSARVTNWVCVLFGLPLECLIQPHLLADIQSFKASTVNAGEKHGVYWSYHSCRVNGLTCSNMREYKWIRRWTSSISEWCFCYQGVKVNVRTHEKGRTIHSAYLGTTCLLPLKA